MEGTGFLIGCAAVASGVLLFFLYKLEKKRTTEKSREYKAIAPEGVEVEKEAEQAAAPAEAEAIPTSAESNLEDLEAEIEPKTGENVPVLKLDDSPFGNKEWTSKFTTMSTLGDAQPGRKIVSSSRVEKISITRTGTSGHSETVTTKAVTVDGQEIHRSTVVEDSSHPPTLTLTDRI